MAQSFPRHRYLLLGPISLLYGLITRARPPLYRFGILKSCKLQSRVVSIGNLTVGGTGKTPLVELTARLLRDMGERVVILSRGYRRRSASPITWVSDGVNLLTSWDEGGDEPYLLARNLQGVPVVVGKDRSKLAAAVEAKLGPCIIVLDDGYQHLRLKRDLDILLLDATDPFGGGRLLPLGRLREPISQVRRADLIVVTHSDHPFDERALDKVRRYNHKTPFLYSYHALSGLRAVKPACKGNAGSLGKSDLLDLSSLSQRRVVAVAGIARNDLFFHDLERFKIRIAHALSFPDHHRYTPSDINKIVSAARRSGADVIVTTEKDAVKMQSLDLGDISFYYVRIEVKMEDEDRYKCYLRQALGIRP